MDFRTAILTLVDDLQARDRQLSDRALSLRVTSDHRIVRRLRKGTNVGLDKLEGLIDVIQAERRRLGLPEVEIMQTPREAA